ncbi:MAG TPA: hypothetical protein VJR29_11930 [bacterium]|nr:hypothetical protein [bacterium]
MTALATKNGFLWTHLESAPEALNPGQKAELQALLKEKDPELLAEGLSNLASRLEKAGQAEAAAQIYTTVLESLPEEADCRFRHKVQSRLEGIQGQGALGPRAEFLLNRFTKDAFDPKVIAPMMLGTSVFSLTRTLALGRFGSSALFRAVGPRFAASSLGFVAEVPAFALSSRALRPASSQEPSIGQELAGAAITLGFLKAFGHGAQTLGATSAFRNGPQLQRHLLSQTAMFGGLMTAHKVEEGLGLRPHVDGATTVTDTLASMLSLGIGASLAHRALGPRYAALQGELNWRFRTYSNESKLKLAPSLAISAVGAPKGFAHPAMQMSGLDRPGKGEAEPRPKAEGPMREEDRQRTIGDLVGQIRDFKLDINSTNQDLNRLETIVVSFLKSLIGAESSVKYSAILTLYQGLHNDAYKGLFSGGVVERKLVDLRAREVRELLRDFVELGQNPDWFALHLSLIARHLGKLSAKSRKQWLQQLDLFLSKEDKKFGKLEARALGPNLKPAELSRVIDALGRSLEQPESEMSAERLEALAEILEYSDGATQLAWIERVEDILGQPTLVTGAGQAKELASLLYRKTLEWSQAFHRYWDKVGIFGSLRSKTDLGTSLGHLYTLKALNGELDSSLFFETMLETSQETRETTASIMFRRLAHLGFNQPPLLYFASLSVRPPSEVLGEKAAEWRELVDRRSLPSELKIKGNAVSKIPDWQYRIGWAFDKRSSYIAKNYQPAFWDLRKIVPIHGLTKESQHSHVKKIEELRQKIILRLLHTGWKKGELPDLAASREILTSEDQYKNAPLISVPTAHGDVMLVNGVHRTIAFITLVGDGYFPFEALYQYPVQVAPEFNPLTITKEAFPRGKVADYSWRDVLHWHPPSLKVLGVNFVASLNRFRHTP